MIVDPDGAKFERVSGAHSFEDIARPDRGCQTVHNIIGLCQCLFFSLEAAHDDDGAEDLVLHNLSIVALFGNHRWLEEKALLETSDAGAFATDQNIGPGAQCPFDIALNALALARRD